MATLTEESLKAMAQEAGEIAFDEAKNWETMSASSYEAIGGVTRGALTEVKSFAAPPVGVKKTLEAALIALGHDLAALERTQRGAWGQAQKILSSPSAFVNTFGGFDPSTITPQMLHELKPYVESEELQPERARKISKACAGIAEWVLCVYEYGTALNGCDIRQLVYA